MKRSIFSITIFVLIFCVATVTKTQNNYFEISKNLSIFGKLYTELNTLYVDGVDPAKSMRTAIDAMLKQLDPYTNFISESQIDEYQFMSTGLYGGIGADVERRLDKFIVTEVYENYPAHKAGLLPGDEILKIGGETVAGVSLKIRDVQNMMKGEKGTKVMVSIRRGGQQAPLEMQLEREQIKVENVPYYGMAKEDIGYIYLTAFRQNAAAEVKAAYTSLKKDHPNMKGVILDLRGNPGGLLMDAVTISNIWVNQGEKIVQTKGKDISANHTHLTRFPAVDRDMPLAVLVNSTSASASEIVAGSLQDLDRAVVVGVRSFGKGLVQNIRPLIYNTQFKVTIAKYYTPSGRCIQAIDYTHRKDDGSVGKVPDSLITAFQTKGGRTVYDGGGVQPDVIVERPKVSSMVTALDNKGMVFNFVTDFVSRNPKIAAASDFQLTDKIYNDFSAYVKNAHFTYQTKVEKQIDKLQAMMKKEGYTDEFNAVLVQLESKLTASKSSDLQKHKKQISKMLRSEIVKRYYFKKGVIEASFSGDDDIDAAISVLRDQDRYNKILGKK